VSELQVGEVIVDRTGGPGCEPGPVRWVVRVVGAELVSLVSECGNYEVRAAREWVEKNRRQQPVKEVEPDVAAREAYRARGYRRPG
jgi:hypothetical protein